MFGICKNCFCLFNRPLECAKDDVKQATKLAIFTLHNFLLEVEESDDEMGEELDYHDNERNGEIGSADDQDDQDFSTRDILLRHNLWLMDD